MYGYSVTEDGYLIKLSEDGLVGCAHEPDEMKPDEERQDNRRSCETGIGKGNTALRSDYVEYRTEKR